MRGRLSLTIGDLWSNLTAASRVRPENRRCCSLSPVRERESWFTRSRAMEWMGRRRYARGSAPSVQSRWSCERTGQRLTFPPQASRSAARRTCRLRVDRLQGSRGLGDERFMNPRNAAAGGLKQLDPEGRGAVVARLHGDGTRRRLSDARGHAEAVSSPRRTRTF